MNKLKIAVLDNGADEKILALCGLPDIIQQNKGNISDEEDLFLHGTNCAMIIGLNCADAELYSYKLLDNTGKGNVDDLKSAFDWCLMNNIRLVNLSFGTTHFKDKGIIRQLVNQYANKGLIIIAATANSGYTAFPASFSNVIGVKAKDTFNIDAEGLRDKGVDFAAPSEHKIWFGGNDITLQKSNSYAAPYVTAMAGRLMMEQSWINNVWQIKKHLYQKFRGKCVQYIPDWIEKGWIAGKVLKSKAEVYFEVAAKEEADTVILYDKNEFNEYREKHIVYLGNEIAEQPDTQCFFWSRRNRKEQILCSRIKKESINIPVILIKSDKEQDQIWWLTELRKCFEAEGYNAYAISTEQESVLGHAVLHTKIAMMKGFQEMEVFDGSSVEEDEANFFAAELLLEDREVLECLSEYSFFETAKQLYVPAALLDYKFSLLHEKGKKINPMCIRKTNFLKDNLGAYDELNCF